MTDWSRYSYQPGPKGEKTTVERKSRTSSSSVPPVSESSPKSEETVVVDFSDTRVLEVIENLETNIRLNLQELHSLMGRLLSHSVEYDISKKTRQLVSDAYLRLSSADTDLVKSIRKLGGKSCRMYDSNIPKKADVIEKKDEEVESELTNYLSELDRSGQKSQPKLTPVVGGALRQRRIAYTPPPKFARDSQDSMK
jgi:hypothetical protein